MRLERSPFSRVPLVLSRVCSRTFRAPVRLDNPHILLPVVSRLDRSELAQELGALVSALGSSGPRTEHERLRQVLELFGGEAALRGELAHRPH